MYFVNVSEILNLHPCKGLASSLKKKNQIRCTVTYMYFFHREGGIVEPERRIQGQPFKKMGENNMTECISGL